MEQLYTVGDLAKQLGIEQHKVTYFINSRKIEPVARVGRYRCYNQQQLDDIREAMGLDGNDDEVG